MWKSQNAIWSFQLDAVLDENTHIPISLRQMLNILIPILSRNANSITQTGVWYHLLVRSQSGTSTDDSCVFPLWGETLMMKYNLWVMISNWK